MTADSINCIVQDNPGGPETLKLGKHPKPFAGPGRVLINVKAAGVNGADLLQRSGKYSPPEGSPNIIGLEVAGIVEADGSEGEKYKNGDKVIALLDGGGYSEYVAASQGLVIPLPEHISFEQGAAIPEVFLTAYLELVWLGKLQKGEDVLIHGGGGGVGSAAIQIAKALGATVFTTAGADDKIQLCKDLGADYAINYKTEDFLEVIKANTKDKKLATGVPLIGSTQAWGVDVILDLVGAAHLEKNIDALNLEGRLLFVGTSTGAEGKINLGKIMGKRLKLIGSTLRARPVEEKEKLVQEFAKFAEPLFEDGTLKPVVDTTFPLAEAKQAHEYMEAKKNKGKIILTV